MVSVAEMERGEKTETERTRDISTCARAHTRTHTHVNVYKYLYSLFYVPQVKPDDYGCVKDIAFLGGPGGGESLKNTTHSILRTLDMDFELTAEQFEFVEMRQKEMRQERRRKLEAQQRLARKEHLASIVG